MGTCASCMYAGRPTYKSPCSECKGYSKHEAVEIRTEADKIRAMSDEELGIFLAEWAEKPWTWKKDGEGECLAWLKQPVEEVNRDAE